MFCPRGVVQVPYLVTVPRYGNHWSSVNSFDSVANSLYVVSAKVKSEIGKRTFLQYFMIINFAHCYIGSLY
jgi:hypothetical protein